MLAIKNVKETAYRFSSVIKFLPNETVVVPENILDMYPAVRVLIERGYLEVVGLEAQEAETEVETEPVDEANEVKELPKRKGRKVRRAKKMAEALEAAQKEQAESEN